MIGKQLAIGSSIVYILSLFFPWPYPTPMVDSAWEQVLHVAFEQHLQFGRDIVFTFGPWGFLYGGYYPPTFPISIIVWALVSLIFWWAGWRLAGHFSRNKLFSWLWLMAFIGITGFPAQQTFDIRATALAMLLLVLYFFVEDQPITVRQVLLTISLGLLGLAKFTSLVEAAAVVVVIALDNTFRRKCFPWIALLFAASLLLFWIAAGQPLNLIGTFLHRSLQITDGYTEAMMWTRANQVQNDIGFLLASAVLALSIGYAAWTRFHFWGILPTAGLGVIAFLTFKHGYVRYDNVHEITTAVELPMLVWVCLAIMWPFFRTKKREYRLAYLLFLGCILFFSLSALSRCYEEANLSHSNRPAELIRIFNIRSILAPIKPLRNPGYFTAVYKKNQVDLRKQIPLPPIEGTVDVYPWNQSVLFAYNLHYHPRPVIQSYSAYTPELETLNAAFLRSDDAARNILFDIDPIDGHFPSLEDGLSWPELLTRYDVANVTASFVIMKRASVPREYHLIPLTNMPIDFDQRVTLPAKNNEPIWAEIEINKSLLGTVETTLYKPPILELTVFLRNGEHFRYRLIPGMAQSGFLLSPLIKDDKSFVALASSNGGHALVNLKVESMVISTVTKSRATVCYQLPMRLRCFRLDFPRQNLTMPTAEKELH